MPYKKFNAKFKGTSIARAGKFTLSLARLNSLPNIPEAVEQQNTHGSLLTAFSLVEMLMALLVASLLLAALAPVLTRKIAGDNINFVQGSDLSEKKVCGYVNDTYEDIEKDDCTAPDDAQYGSAIIVSGGGGGSGATDSVKSESKTLTYEGISGADNNTTQKQYEFKFNRNIDTITLALSGGAGGGGGGNYKSSLPTKQLDCEPFGIYIRGNYNGTDYPVCVTKFNPSKNGGDGSPKTSGILGVTTVNVNETCNPTTTMGCCWLGGDYGNGGTPRNDSLTTAATGCNALTGGYSGCNRTVCTWHAADSICTNWKPTGGVADGKTAGRLPSFAELAAWGKNYTQVSKGRGTDGLQLCSGELKADQPNCYYTQRCLGASSGGAYCNPRMIWGNRTDETFYSYGYSRNEGFSALVTNAYYDSFTVRCVYEGKFSSYTGGGGGSGIGLAGLMVPKEVIAYATKNNGVGTIKIYAGSGGKGGKKQNAESGTGGSSTKVEIYAPDDSAPIWTIEAAGGYAGKGASTSSGGSGALEVNAYDKNCKFQHRKVAGGTYETLTNIACSQIPNASTSSYIGYGHGNGGKSGDNGGYGGRALWDGIWRVVPGDSDSGHPADAAGKNGTGANGGKCTLADTGAITCEDGGNGGAGAVFIHYTTKSPGIGGSGGGAGSVLHIVNFRIQPKGKVEIKAGKRGKGGGSNSNGSDGGDSYIKVNGKTYLSPGGKGGKAGNKGIPATDNMAQSTMPTAGNAGEGGKINITDNSVEIIKINGESGSTGIVGNNNTTSEGGNGGINSKISMFADIPCGGLSTVSAGGVACNRSSNIPTILTRILTKDDFNSAFKSIYAAGATGGGGGGWNDNLPSGTTAASGADGLGGYVFVYFGGW